VPQEWKLTAIAVAMAESGLNTTIIGYNGPTQGCPNGSRDRGLWQINDCYHPQFSDAQCFTDIGNARAMLFVSNGGVNWNPWTTYKTGAYRANIPAVISGLKMVTIAPAPFNPITDARSRVDRGENPLQAAYGVMGDILGQVGRILTGQ
jgi:hypothetical protein